MSIEAVSALTSGAVSGTGYLSETAGSTAAAGTSASDGAFASSLASAVENVQGLQSNADSLAVQAVTGDLEDVHQYTIAATEAAVTLELVSAVRNKAVEAFTNIMNMQA
ncbi:flagellar hook-basal body complex protein FliE [Demequina salsinemoris]|uniref:flagellar hook-basal body complex protein FliE n=1 Tax=Demequina salsinemoris TaxID=577470 RepID=UPI00078303E2|nr:flagellar hook-basal body complex protein FliE [Demequina salsinemoris]